MLPFSVPSTAAVWIVGLLAYVVSYLISAVKFKEDILFHRWVYGICIAVVFIFSVLTVLQHY